jgi:purine-binding chemotaxis protein CheW
MSQVAARQNQKSQQFLTFLLDGQEYGLELLTIREIQGYTPITAIPNVPAHVRGVINLRGSVVPVVDLRLRFGLPHADYGKFTVVVIAMVAEKLVGLLVDAVSDVLHIGEDEVRDAPDFGTAVDTRFIRGIFQTRQHLAVALNLETLLADEALQMVA